MAKQSSKKTTKKTVSTSKKANKVDFEPNKVALAVATMAVVSLVLIVMIMTY